MEFAIVFVPEAKIVELVTVLHQITIVDVFVMSLSLDASGT